jgi:4-amino-4-deoxy-L-arabinose transferase-like glycosyltransferase
MSSLSYAVGARLRVRDRVAVRYPELFGLLGLTAVLYLWNLGVNGWANMYYSAAVRSMSTSWHDFVFASLDKSGLMTLDKPPLAFWVQALSARVFGFHPLSLLVPEALMGVAAVGLAYDLTRRRFGRAAGLAAGLVFALTPITVAVARHNNLDELLVLCCVAALWCAVRALETGRTRWLLWSGVCVGLGFETKMGVALLVVPGIGAAYLYVAPRGRVRAVRQLLAGGAAMAVVGLAWPLLVTLTPAADRPWVSGTSDNSVWSLIFGYNGLGRVAGQSGGPGGVPRGVLFGGATGPFRLLESGLGDQAGWLLGFAAVAAVVILVLARGRRRDPRTGWVLAVGGSLLASAVVFSFAHGIFHPYYVSFLAPFAAALVGAGFSAGLRGTGKAARVVAPLVIAGGVATELVVLSGLGGALSWAVPVVMVAGVAAVALALLLPARVRAGVAAVALTALLAARRRGRRRRSAMPPTARSRPAGRRARWPGAVRAVAVRSVAVRSVAGSVAWARAPADRSPADRSPATAQRSPPRSTTPRPTVAGRSAWRAKAAPPRRSSPLTPTWPASAGSPAGRARWRRRGWPTRYVSEESAG